MLVQKHAFCLSLWILIASSEEKANRQQKQFSLFSVVTFGNLPCQGTNNEEGICYTAAECASKNGQSIGNCAAGFGTCCQFTLDTCGSEARQNITYITNPNFPATYTDDEDCEFRINPVNTAICQLRLDFINFSLNKVAGQCPDSLTLTNPLFVAGGLCGELAGEHLYVDTARSATALELVFNTNDAAGTWRIKVSQVECYNVAKAPNGCAQYYTGASGEFKSYSFGDTDTSMFRSAFYTICIRREQGFCSIDYAVQDVDGTVTAFKLADATATALNNFNQAMNEVAYLTIPNTEATVYSGQFFADGDAKSTQHGTIRALGPDFRVGVTAITPTGGNTPLATRMVTGFYLTYNQVAC
eukprot:08337.XXX_203625_201134_1 [CDS] Oithona nana genome sequencing.